MTGHRLEVADVFHAHQHEFLQRWGHALSDQQRKVLRDIGLCRTAALGTHLERCDRCSYETVAYDSCRNRHCPKCQSSARDRWLLKQAQACCRCPMPMWYSLYLNNWRRSHCATRGCFYCCCFAQLPRRCWRSPPIRAISARASASSLFFIPGAEPPASSSPALPRPRRRTGP